MLFLSLLDACITSSLTLEGEIDHFKLTVKLTDFSLPYR